MKIRNGFVANSSTSSFVVVFDEIPLNLEYYIQCLKVDEKEIDEHNKFYHNNTNTIIYDAAMMVLEETINQKFIKIDISDPDLFNKLSDIRRHWGYDNKYMNINYILDNDETYCKLIQKYLDVCKQTDDMENENSYKDRPIDEQKMLGDLYAKQFDLEARANKMADKLCAINFEDFVKEHDGKYILAYSFEDYEPVEAFIHNNLDFKNTHYVKICHH